MIAHLCVNANVALLLMNMWTICSNVNYLLLKLKIDMTLLFMKFILYISMLQNRFLFQDMVVCDSTGDDGRTPDGFIRGLNLKPLYLDVTIANPTSDTYFNRGSSREEHG